MKPELPDPPPEFIQAFMAHHYGIRFDREGKPEGERAWLYADKRAYAIAELKQMDVIAIAYLCRDLAQAEEPRADALYDPLAFAKV